MKLIGSILLGFILLISTQKETDIIRMQKSSLSSEIVEIDTLKIEINDTIPNKTLVIYSDENNNPIKYSRDIITGVCIEGECRLLKIKLFWNVTGRYLGFVLPDGEFLSKNEHEPFKSEEYNRLHNILAERNSPLANYSINELVPQKDSSQTKVDAVSSATIAAVLDHIVEGAVYTTYTLWHIVYGPTKREVENFCLSISS